MRDQSLSGSHKLHPSATTQSQHPMKQGLEGSHGATATEPLASPGLPILLRGPTSFPWQAAQAHPAASACASAEPIAAPLPAPVSSAIPQAPSRPKTGSAGMAALGITHPAAARQGVPRQQPFLGGSSAQLPTSAASQAPGSCMGAPPPFYGHPQLWPTWVSISLPR